MDHPSQETENMSLYILLGGYKSTDIILLLVLPTVKMFLFLFFGALLYLWILTLMYVIPGILYRYNGCQYSLISFSFPAIIHHSDNLIWKQNGKLSLVQNTDHDQPALKTVWIPYSFGALWNQSKKLQRSSLECEDAQGTVLVNHTSPKGTFVWEVNAVLLSNRHSGLVYSETD